MNDSRDMKSVNQHDKYMSCIRINGVPILPPVLTKECRKEMQYYKLLAKEVEKRVTALKSFYYGGMDTIDNEASDDSTIAQCYEIPLTEIKAGFSANIEKITAITNTDYDDSYGSGNAKTSTNLSISSNIVVNTSDTIVNPPKLIIDLSLGINETGKHILESLQKSTACRSLLTNQDEELPEHDYTKPELEPEILTPQKELLVDTEVNIPRKIRESDRKKKNSLDSVTDVKVNTVDEITPSLSKSFTGSLNEIHSSKVKLVEDEPKLVRQHSYTVLNPSPQLLAHLEMQTQNTGQEITTISMTESSTSPYKKRRSWDLESAKVKWSSMALELEQVTVPGRVKKTNGVKVVNGANELNSKNHNELSSSNNANNIKVTCSARQRSRSVAGSRPRKDSVDVKSETNQTAKDAFTKRITSSTTVVKAPLSKKNIEKGRSSSQETTLQRNQSDYSNEELNLRIRELYEELQKQQVSQMSSLMEKQKKEQILLQQVFEEQNNMLLKKLQSLCTASSTEVKKAWDEKHDDRGPVSLRQLINNDTMNSAFDNHYSNTVTKTSSYIRRCDNVLKKSKDVAKEAKRQVRPTSPNAKFHSVVEGARPRNNTPKSSRKLNYGSPSDKDCDQMLTDRTNDTMADLNYLTFTTDSEESSSCLRNTYLDQPGDVFSPSSNTSRTDSAIKNLEHTIQNSMRTMNIHSQHHALNGSSKLWKPTPKEQDAATRIVAHAKGYLIRRLMRTERVQATVQTIKEALLCALSLHREREGIRGADVDLHRRLIQQITAGCYALHEMFVTSSPAERCAVIAADRARLRALATKTPVPARHATRTRKSHE